jgi:hypothetical protein
MGAAGIHEKVDAGAQATIDAVNNEIKNQMKAGAPACVPAHARC